jgi:hypothetical protein
MALFEVTWRALEFLSKQHVCACPFSEFWDQRFGEAHWPLSGERCEAAILSETQSRRVNE